MDPQSKFRNDSGGVAGAIKLDHKGEAVGVPVYPGDSVWLTEKEQVLTANAPRNESDNPFTNGTFTLEVKSEEATHARPIGDSQAAGEPAPEPEPSDEVEIREEQPAAGEQAAGEQAAAPNEGETGAPEPPAGDPPAGQSAQHEEVADVETPPAPPAPEAPAPKAPPAPLPKPPAPAG